MNWKEQARGFAGKGIDRAALEARDYIDTRLGTRPSQEEIAKQRASSQVKTAASAPARRAAKKQ